MRTPVKFTSKKQFNQCVDALRGNLLSLGVSVADNEELQGMMARVAGYDTANEVLLMLQSTEVRGAGEDAMGSHDRDVFIYSFDDNQLTFQGKSDTPKRVWDSNVSAWQHDVRTRSLGIEDDSSKVFIDCVETATGPYFAATLKLQDYAQEQLESAYRVIDHFVTHQPVGWPGLMVALRMVDALIFEASSSGHSGSPGVLLRMHNALANGRTIMHAADGDKRFMLNEFGENLCPETVRAVFGGHRLKMRQMDIQKRAPGQEDTPLADYTALAATQVCEDTWRALMATLSLVLNTYEGVYGKSLSSEDFAQLVRNNEAHLRRHMTRAFFLGHVPAMNAKPIPSKEPETEC